MFGSAARLAGITLALALTLPALSSADNPSPAPSTTSSTAVGMDYASDAPASSDVQCQVPIADRTGGWTCGGGTAGESPRARTEDTGAQAGEDYLGAQQNASADQCQVPVDQRAGGWVCGDQDAGARGVEPAVAGQRCLSLGVKGCWTVNQSNPAYAEFHETGMKYRYSNNTLGTINLGFSWKLSGPAVVGKPISARMSRATTSHWFSGSVFNGSVGVVGSLKNSCPDAHFGLTAAGSLRQWTPNGCPVYDSDSYDHYEVIEISWYDPVYAGRWWTYVRSPAAHSADKRTYLFNKSAGLPGDPWSAGYDPAG